MTEKNNGILKVQKVDNDIPLFKHSYGDAGYDLYVTKDTWIYPFKVNKVPVNVKCQIENFHFGLTTSRSGETLKGNIVIPGIIDNTYRGQISALMFRVGLLPKKIKKNTRIAQLIIIPYKECTIISEKLDNSTRGENGYGSSGIK